MSIQDFFYPGELRVCSRLECLLHPVPVGKVFCRAQYQHGAEQRGLGGVRQEGQGWDSQGTAGQGLWAEGRR